MTVHFPVLLPDFIKNHSQYETVITVIHHISFSVGNADRSFPHKLHCSHFYLRASRSYRKDNSLNFVTWLSSPLIDQLSTQFHPALTTQFTWIFHLPKHLQLTLKFNNTQPELINKILPTFVNQSHVSGCRQQLRNSTSNYLSKLNNYLSCHSELHLSCHRSYTSDLY